MDLNLIVQRESEKLNRSIVVKKIQAAFKLGYEVIALNVVIGPQELGAKNKIPEPPCYTVGEAEAEESRRSNRRLRILTRLTAVLTDNIQCHRLFQSPVTKKYDILAVSPTQERMFQQLCNQGEFDILCLPLDSKMPFLVKRAQYGSATGRGIVFEIQYCPCIRDTTCLHNTLANAQTLVHAGKGKGVIITGGSWLPQELRGPLDVASLGFLYGLSECTAREAIYGNCKAVLRHAETRTKTNRAIVFAKPVEALTGKDRWLVDACKAPAASPAEETSTMQDAAFPPDGPPARKKKKKSQTRLQLALQTQGVAGTK